ncbi:MAG: hypothetical protein WCJ42_04800 [Actinomycetes bacterium]
MTQVRRVYVPVTASQLRTLLADRRLPLAAGFAVTPSLQDWYGTGDDEQLEHAACFRASESAAAGTRRIVLPLEVPESGVEDVGTSDDPGAVRITAVIELSWVAAILAGDDEDLAWYGVQEADQVLD